MVQTTTRQAITFKAYEKLTLRGTIVNQRGGLSVREVDCIIISPANPRRCIIDCKVMKFSYQHVSNKFNVFPPSKAKRKLNPAVTYSIVNRQTI